MPDLDNLMVAIKGSVTTPWDDRVPDLRISLEAAAARVDVAEHVRRCAARLEDRLGLNTWEARRARMHRQLEHARDMLNQAHDDALRHLGGDLPTTGLEFAGVPIHADLSLPPDVIELHAEGRVVGTIERDSRGRFTTRIAR